MDKVRILRIIEYVGPRDQVEEQVTKSIHGSRKFRDVVIRATTLGEAAEILSKMSHVSVPVDPSLSHTLGVKYASPSGETDPSVTCEVYNPDQDR